MIFDSLKNMDNYKKNAELYSILQYLKGLKAGELPAPGTVIKKDEILCNPVSFTTKPEDECLFEAHQKFIDLHYIVEGTEKIVTADVKSLSVHTPYDSDKDIGFYTGEGFGHYLLKKGDFMVCYPSDAHKVAIMQEKPESVTKIVVKIHVETDN